MPKHNFKSLMKRLSAAGFKREFAHVAVLPDWWDASCENDANLLPDVELRVARFVGAPLATVRDPDAPLAAPKYEGAQLRRVRDINKDRLGPAIHAALQIGGAVIRNMREQTVRLPPTNPIEWRNAVAHAGPVLQLSDLVADLWARGIPVIHTDSLPTPCFQGLAGIVDGRPIIVLAHDLDEPARLAFIVAHEVGHIVAGDCEPGRPVVDEEDEVADDTEIERKADDFATIFLTGGTEVPDVRATGYKDLALQAHDFEQKHGVDASAVVWAWARRTGNWPVATMASKALYRTQGGKLVLREGVDNNVRINEASESDRALLRCLVGDTERDGTAG